jgi:ribonuclease Z
VTFLGTAGSVPTPKRSLPAVVVEREGEQIMFDCGEGAQRQIIRAKIGFHKKMKVFITHMHGDHVLGLPGLLQTMALLNRERTLQVYGPGGIISFLTDIRKSLQFALTFPVEIREIARPGIVCREREYYVKAVRSNHVVEGWAYALVESSRPGRFHPEKAQALGIPKGPAWSKLQHGHSIKLSDGQSVKAEDVTSSPRLGRKIVYTGDTRPFEGLTRFAEKADLIIHDATLDDSLADRAKEDGHSTPSQAAKSARKAGAKKLILTHISARYDDTSVLLEQARKIFKDTQVADDFMEMKIPLKQG